MEELDLMDTNVLSKVDRTRKSILTSDHMIEEVESLLTSWKRIVDAISVTDERMPDDNIENEIRLLEQRVLDIDDDSFFINSGEETRHILLEYLDLFDTDGIKYYFPNATLNNEIDSTKEHVIRGLASIVKRISRSVDFIDDYQLKKYKTLFILMVLMIDHQFSTEFGLKPLEIALLDFFCNMCDIVALVPLMLDIGLGKCCMNCFSSKALTDDERESILTIIHNLCRHDQGSDELNKYGALDVLKEWHTNHKNESSEIYFLMIMSIAHLSSSDQIKIDFFENQAMIDKILQMIIIASNREGFRDHGFHISEPLSALVKLFTNDLNVDYIANQTIHDDRIPDYQSIVSFLSDLLVRFSFDVENQNSLTQFTFMALCNIIWSISFREQYQDILRKDVDLIETLIPISQTGISLSVDQYIPRSMLNVNQAADGILVNLKLDNEIQSKYLNDEIGSSTKPLVMISYSHANEDFCDKLLEFMDEKSYVFDVWIDKRFCKSNADIWESIALAMKKAILIVPIVSTEYILSKACRQELIYAKDRLNKPMLPVYLEKPTITGWLDIRIAEFKYIRFTNMHEGLSKRKIDQFLSTLIETIQVLSNTDDKAYESHQLVDHEYYQKDFVVRDDNSITELDETIQMKSLTVWDWDQTEVNKWYEKNHIPIEIRELYQFKTGAQLLLYAEFLENGGVIKQYEQYKKRFKEKYSGKELIEHEFALFAGALKKLLDHNRSSTTTMAAF